MSDDDLVARLAKRVQQGRGAVAPRKVVVRDAAPGTKRPIPTVHKIPARTPEFNRSEKNAVRFYLDAMKDGRSISDLFAEMSSKQDIATVPRAPFGEPMTPDQVAAMNRLFEQRIADSKREYEKSATLNDTSAVEDRPHSPGQEYDLQYMEQALPKPPRFSAEVHERMLEAQNVGTKEREKLMSSAVVLQNTLEKQYQDQVRVERRRPKAPEPAHVKPDPDEE